MDVSTAQWLSEMGMEDPSFLYECEMDHFFHDPVSQFTPNFTSQAVNANTPSSRSKRSFNDSADCDSFTYQTVVEKPAKEQKIDHWNSDKRQNLASKSSSLPFSDVISFGNHPNPQLEILKKVYGNSTNKEEPVAPTRMNFSYDYVTVEYVEDAQKVNIVRSSIQAKDHVIAERRRREKLNQGFIALSSLLPGLTKLDKASILGVAIQHIKELQENAKGLEEETIQRNTSVLPDIVRVTKPCSSGDDNSSSSVHNDDNIFFAKSNFEVEVRVCDSDVLIRVRCEKQNGIIGKIFGEIEKSNMVIINSNAMPFGHTSLAVSIVAQIVGQLSASSKDLASNLRSALRV